MPALSVAVNKEIKLIGSVLIVKASLELNLYMVVVVLFGYFVSVGQAARVYCERLIDWVCQQVRLWKLVRLDTYQDIAFLEIVVNSVIREAYYLVIRWRLSGVPLH